MVAYFQERGEAETAALFRPSSMEYMRQLGGDPFTLVSEMPLFLRPTERHLPVVRYWEPEEFAALEKAAYALGFEHIAAGPLVRSSYHADEHVKQDRPGIGPLAASA